MRLMIWMKFIQIINLIDSIHLEHDRPPENRFTFFGIMLGHCGRS
jgi:hypothetical protein